MQYASMAPENTAQASKRASDAQVEDQKNLGNGFDFVKMLSNVGGTIAQMQKEIQEKTRPQGTTPFTEKEQPNLDLSRYGRVERDIGGNIVGLGGKELRDEQGRIVGKAAPDWQAAQENKMQPSSGLSDFYMKNPQLKKSMETKPSWETPAAGAFSEQQKAMTEQAKQDWQSKQKPQSNLPKGAKSQSTTTQNGTISSVSGPYGYAVGASGGYLKDGSKDLAIGFAREDQKKKKATT